MNAETRSYKSGKGWDGGVRDKFISELVIRI